MRGLNPLNWARRSKIGDFARRRFWNKKALAEATAQSAVLTTPDVSRPTNRADRRDWRRSRVGRQAVRAYRLAVRRQLRAPLQNYPVLSRCMIGKCRRLPRYRGLCYTHLHERTLSYTGR